MNKRLSAILIMAILLPFSIAAKGRLETFTIHSSILQTDKICNVYLPDGYNPQKHYPVLYLLHGLGGTYKTWESIGVRDIADACINGGESIPMVIVMPDAAGTDGNTRGLHVGYTNRPDWRYEDFFVEELIPQAEQKYSIRPGREYRSVAGLSMGGLGTALFAFNHPELFATAFMMSARLTGTASPDRSKEYAQMVLENDFIKRFDEMSDLERQKLAGLRWFFDCGDDDSLLDGSYGLFMRMRKAGIPSELRVRNGGHNKLYWKESLRLAMGFITVGIISVQ